MLFFSPSVQLLMPHFRYTLHINTGGRKTLFGPNGALNEVRSSTSLLIMNSSFGISCFSKESCAFVLIIFVSLQK